MPFSIPLFVEHLVAMLFEDGTLAPGGETWAVRGDLDSLAVPPTVNALIATRLELLQADRLAELERASVEGKAFHGGAVLALSPDGEAAEISQRLMAHVRRDLIRPGESLFAGEDGLHLA